MIRKETFVIALVVGCTASFFLGRHLRPAPPAPAAATQPTAAQPAAAPAGVARAGVPAVAPGAAAKPQPAKPAASPFKGPNNAKVTIVEISDFECPFCSRVGPTLAQIRGRWADDVQIIWKNNPLGFHARAMPAALAAMAAVRQDKFWEMHDKLFANQDQMTDANLAIWAKELGLNVDQWQQDVQDPKLRAQIVNEQAAAVALGQGGTPGFLINGRALSGAQPFSEFEGIIVAELQAANDLIAKGTPPEEVHRARVRANLGSRAEVYWTGLIGAQPVAAPPPPPRPQPRAAPAAPPQERWKAAIRGDEPTKGPADALVTIVEYTDFECPFCSKVGPSLTQIRETWPNDVRIVFKNNPLPFHAGAEPAARAARAAQAQGKFWEMHDKLFSNQTALKAADLEKYATELGLDLDRFRKDMASPAIKKRVADDLIEASEVSAEGTPAFYINGIKLEGALPFPKFKVVIDQELNRARALVARGTARAELYATIMKNAKVFKVLDDRDNALTTSGSPILGNPDGDIAIYEFSDFECPYCSRLGEPLKALIADPEIGSRIKVVFKHFPLGFHKQARPAAVAAMAAHEQGKFWEMHDIIFQRQPQLNAANLRSWAEEIGLDMGKYDAFVNAGKGNNVVDRDMMEAQRSNVDGTPSIFINGRRFRPMGGYTVAAFKEAIAANFPKKP